MSRIVSALAICAATAFAQDWDSDRYLNVAGPYAYANRAQPYYGRERSVRDVAEYVEDRYPIVEAEPVKVEEKEKVVAEPVKAEPIKAEPIKAEPIKAEPVKAEPVIGSDGYILQKRTAEGPYETIYAKCALQDPEEEAYARGVINFTQKYGGPVQITGSIVDLKPGLHGFHVHELGDLREGCTSTGGHYQTSVGEHVHGYGSEHKMAGDLIQADADSSGVAIVDQLNDRFDLFGSWSVIGRGLVVHKKSDQEGAGARIACCTIGLTGAPKASYGNRW